MTPCFFALNKKIFDVINNTDRVLGPLTGAPVIVDVVCECVHDVLQPLGQDGVGQRFTQ